jgi:hypothetical protein
MNLIFPSHPFHSNVTARNRPIVTAFTNAFHAISTQVHFARASPNPREVPLPSPLTLSVSGNGPQCIRISRYGMRKYLGSTNGVGTRTAAVHATKPMIQYTPCLLPTQRLDHRPSSRKRRTDFPQPCPSTHKVPRRQRVRHDGV